MFTQDQRSTLERLFPVSEHRFVNGQPYLPKHLIRRRLNEVDSHWSLTPPEVIRESDDVVVARGALVVLGVTRFDIGTGIIQRFVKDKQTEEMVELEGYDLARAVARAHKTAATDILSRCAVQFGVGWYLKDVPPKTYLNTPQLLGDYLDKIKTTAPGAHWAHNGGGQRVTQLMKKLGLEWKYVAAHIEPDQTLGKLSDTTLSETDFVYGLFYLKLEEAANATGS